jgi:6-phosphogluconolactonase/glucosamine-6-phosphate isomerase/deaminase
MATKRYSIISSVEGDWTIAASKEGNCIVALSGGHSRSQALEAILKDLGVEVHHVERDMGDGDYFPKKNDFKKRDKCQPRTKK